jgi:AbrB family looped-hinge helix DNA binding protein
VAQSAVEGGQGLAAEQIGRSDLDHATVRRYLTRMKTAISTKGQIVLPVAIREQDGIEPGQEFELERIDRGEYRLTRLSSRANEGVVDWLLACPQKGFFTPIESESTDDL